MHKNAKEIIYKIQEFSFSVLLIRLIALCIAIYFILNFNDDPFFYGFLLLFLAFVILIATEKKAITITKFGIEYKEFNLLNVFTKTEFMRHKDISTIEYTPSEFSFTIFLLNGIMRSGIDPDKASILKIKMKDGTENDFKNIGNKLDADNLNKIIIANQ